MKTIPVNVVLQRLYEQEHVILNRHGKRGYCVSEICATGFEYGSSFVAALREYAPRVLERGTEQLAKKWRI